MSVQQSDRVRHVPYVEAVERCLAARDLHVARLNPSGPQERREATLLLRLDADPAGSAAGVATVTWDEDTGRTMAIQPDSAQEPAQLFGKGLGVVPDPEDVAAWVTVLMARSDLTPSREDQPDRDLAVQAAETEACLARYAAAAP